ncbi:MAG TPA: hypothetical protein VJY62_00270 [Bacteroidia bacterium]|nr:hypothetical protein [Bacteroidia bacterium]
MTAKQIILTLLLVFMISIVNGQHLASTIEDAGKQGISISHLDSIYTSAIHVDTSQSVFKSETEQQALGEAYMKLLQDFGKFLTANNFKWEKPTRGFNRIYFNTDGTIDYFLYNFQTKNVKPEDQLSQEKQTEFNRLLNLFIKDYKISLTARTKFAQCSPTTYMPKELK